MKLALTDGAAAAMADVLGTIGPQGRVEIRMHARLTRMLKDACLKSEDGVEARWQAGEVVIEDKEVAEHFVKAMNVKVKHGVPGRLAEGYEKLIELVDPDGG